MHAQATIPQGGRASTETSLREQVFDTILRITKDVRAIRKHIVSITLVSAHRPEQAERIVRRYERLWSKIDANVEAITMYDRKIGYIVVAFNYDIQTRQDAIAIKDLRER